MDRALSIALLCAALAAVGSYGLLNVVRTGETMLVLTPIRRKDSPIEFWAFVGMAAAVLAAAAVTSAVYFVRWISQ
jgi:hypothetical protein